MRFSRLFFVTTIILTVTAGFGHAQSDRLAKSVIRTKSEKLALDASLPPSVRRFLETAGRFEVYAQLEIRDGELQASMDRNLVPNFKTEVTSIDGRQKLLKSLYSEASKDEPPAVCYLPSHAIVAEKGAQKVKVEICFGCNRFFVSGSLGESQGTFSRASGETERLITKLIAESGVTVR